MHGNPMCSLHCFVRLLQAVPIASRVCGMVCHGESRQQLVSHYMLERLAGQR
jgi:hypothetical protein